ncbi:MAG: TetR/AcrR family transcriptional regulator [Nocardioides sp.]
MTPTGVDHGEGATVRANELSGLRRQPVQARSRERVALIVSAASRLLTRDGVAGLTMRRLADEAGVPIGSLYQFFEDRTAVMDAVVAKHGASLRATLDSVADTVDSRPGPRSSRPRSTRRSSDCAATRRTSRSGWPASSARTPSTRTTRTSRRSPTCSAGC